jgi:hypothetical protein
MMRFHALLAAGLSLAFTLTTIAQTKSPADAAADAFFKLRDDKEAKVDQARLQAIMTSGIDFLAANPTHGRAWNVITALGMHAGTIREKKLAPIRDYWVSHLKYEIVNRRTARDQSEEQQAVWAALGAVLAGYEARVQVNRDTVDAYRAALDRLAEQPKGARFIVNAEREYVRFLFEARSPRLAAQVKKLQESSDKRLVTMANEENNLIVARTTPWEMKFTALDGKEFDAAAGRGKLLLVVFFSAKRDATAKELDAIQGVTDYAKEVVVVGVALDAEEDRAAVEKLVKSQRLKWPVLLGGAAKDNEFAQRLNLRSATAAFLFDRAGLLAVPNIRTDRLEAEIKRLQNAK